MIIPFEDRPLVYIAGPYSNGDPVWNTNKMIKIGNELQDTGLVTTFVPHLSLFLHAIDPRPYEHWLEWDIALLKRCDALLRVPGLSSGADKEEVYAVQKDMPVFDDQSLLIKWAQEWLFDHGYRYSASQGEWMMPHEGV
jgi:hypothetical protein